MNREIKVTKRRDILTCNELIINLKTQGIKYFTLIYFVLNISQRYNT